MNKCIITQISVNDILNTDDGRAVIAAYAEESASDLLPAFRPDVAMYNQLEELGIVDALGVFSDNTLVGFATCATIVMPHYSVQSTTVESIFILKPYRKFGTGKKLMSEITRIAKDRESVALFLAAKVDGTLERVIDSFGYKHTNTLYTKALA